MTSSAALGPGDRFVCERCGGMFVTVWTQTEADAEYAVNFPGQDVSLARLVCDVCYPAELADRP